MADIAAAASVTVRAVQLSFHRHLGTTPHDYLRHIRLEHAHQDPIAAAPDDTVTVISARWKFSSSSRFSAYYRAAYGVQPSYTLRHGHAAG